MTFIESIKVCFSKYTDFNGRATRPEFWWWCLFTLLAGIAVSVVSQILSVFFSLGTLLPSVAVCARRLHDTNRSGWWQLIGFIPVIGWVVLIVWCVQEAKEPNRFG